MSAGSTSINSEVAIIILLLWFLLLFWCCFVCFVADTTDNICADTKLFSGVEYFEFLQIDGLEFFFLHFSSVITTGDLYGGICSVLDARAPANKIPYVLLLVAARCVCVCVCASIVLYYSKKLNGPTKCILFVRKMLLEAFILFTIV